LRLPAQAAPEIGPLRAYSLGLVTVTERTPLSAGGVDLQHRLRMMLEPRFGALDAEVAWESDLSVRNRSGPEGTPFEAAGRTGDWLGVSWTPVQGSHGRWVHRFDRLDVGLSGGSWELRSGRQAISWATTLLLTPADPFAPFDPSDPYREYRPGVDAVRFSFYPGPFSSAEMVVRPASTPDGTTITALGRARFSAGAWDLATWAGVLHDRAAGAASAAVSAGGWVVRGEMSVRSAERRGVVARVAAGADRRVDFFGRDLHVVAELQHDGLGASSAGELATVAASPPARRGELQVLGRDVGALQLSWQLHPLVTVAILELVDLRDGSFVSVPSAAWSVSSSTELRAGMFMPAGPRPSSGSGGPASDFGSVPWTAYLSLAAFL
jgi:hypothetical protein